MPPRVLLVDDDRALLEALPASVRLRLPEVAIDTCDSAALAVQSIREVDYDAIVSDIKMPGIDGLALLAVVRRLRADTPTLLITGHGEHDLAVQALRGGAYDFIAKPIDRDYFAASLRRALQTRALQRQVESQREALERRAEELDEAVRERTRQLLQTVHAKDQLLAEREQALAEARSAQRRLAFLAEASNLLGSFDYERTLDALVRLAVPTLGACCLVQIDAQSDALPDSLALCSNDPEQASRLRSLAEETAGNVARGVHQRLGGGSSARLIRGGDGSPDLLPRQQAFLAALGPEVVIAPVEFHGRSLGTMTFAAGDATAPYTEDDVELIHDLARRLGLAIEHARLDGESQAVREHLERANEAKDEFLALISHEMRTPLTTVHGSAQLLLTRADRLSAERRRGVVESLAREAERLRRIVEDLLVLARVEMGAELRISPVSIEECVRAVSDAFSHLHPERPLEIVLPSDLPSLAGEATYVEQVLHNLLSNADKYSPAGCPVEVRAERDGAAVRVSVLDRGSGVAPHEVDLIFERFYRSEGSHSHASGIGMGLTVCRRLVEALSGRIWASPRDGGGLEVAFTIPVWTATEEPAPAPEEATAAPHADPVGHLEGA